MLTGDNPAIMAKVCHNVDLDSGNILIGPDIKPMRDKNLSKEVELGTIFCR
ncbi:Magnesium transport ATPase, P-type 2 [Xenorhabdus beddingii]|uniref:Magnesium transport ATPase, P-type 2 n=1 Tax=Xenorhabdus beddingii TaxID=40578 RepID=A0A1Y2SQQ4_9GAMM|nr:magnesium ABC transporter ATPase [Xenorhabdus beddingii]OTA21133.1 Magnesium transport ATPase, P-type 2 [Xenorhabdus beddingii]